MRTPKRRPRKIPKGRFVGGRKKKDNKGRRRKKKNNIVRGKEITIRESASEAQIVYGQMRIGGVTTFVETSQDSAAYLITGQEGDQNQLVWTARTAGSGGNSITITIVCTGTNGAIIVSVASNDISVRVASSGGVSSSTMAQVIAAVRADSAANALVRIEKLNAAHNDNVDAVAQTALSFGGGTWLHQMITLAGHQIEAIDELHLDNREVTFGYAGDPRWGTGIWDVKVFMAFQNGADDQSAQPDLMQQLPSLWTSDHRQRGCAGAYLILVWNVNLFAEGLPEIAFVVRGKPCYDPRTATTVYTKNAALILGDYLMNTKFGLGIPLAAIDDATWQAAADICDESVSLAGGGSEARYEINGVFDASEAPEDIIDQMLAAMGGDLVYESGKFYIYPAAYRAPTVTLTIDDLRGDLVVNSKQSRSERFNSARGTYAAAVFNYAETDIPHVTNSTYVTEDGGVVWEDFALNFVTSGAQAQRLLKIELERVRQGISVLFPAKVGALQLRVGDTVSVTLARYGWSSKVFEVQGSDFVLDDDGTLGVDLLLRETASTVFDWDSGEETEIDPAPDTNLPDPFDVDEPTNLTLTSGTSELYVRNDGTVQTRLKVEWDSSGTEFVMSGGVYEIQFKRNADVDWNPSFSVPGSNTFVHLTDVEDGVAYDVRIRAVNTLGYASDWVEELNHTVIGKTAPPSDVTGFTATPTDQGVLFSWTKISDADVGEYEIRLGATWGSATLITRVKASGNSYTHAFFTAGATTFTLKAIDTTGNYSTNAASAIVTINNPNPIQGFGATTVDNNVLLDWTDPVASTLSVNEYDVYKGDTFATALKIGTVFGTFHTYVEQLGGTFTYWVVAVDIGGNRSSEVSTIATIVAPDDFYILESLNPLTDADTVTTYNVIAGGHNAELEDPEKIWLPFPMNMVMNPLPYISGPPNWQAWGAIMGWTTIQDAIDAGFNVFAEAGILMHFWIQFEIDYTVTFASSFIDFSWLGVTLGSVPETIHSSISTSADGVTWSTPADGRQLFAENFRYVRLKLYGENVSPFSCSMLTDFLVEISVSRSEETGTAACVAGDASGTEVLFTKDWLDVEDIQLTVEGTDPAYPVLNFTDTPNPTSFRILVFDEDGARVSKNVRYRVRGALNP